MSNKLLLIEDDKSIGKGLCELLKQEGFTVEWSENLADAKNKLSNQPQLIVLDWMLPDGQGIDFLKQLRIDQNLTPVIMLTARVELIDKILGLESGANDYISKPFEPRELVARIRVQLRNLPTNTIANNNNPSELNVGELHFDLDSHTAFFSKKELDLTRMEYELLRLLAESPGRTYSREEILNKVWGYENFPTTRTVDTHVLQLRQKTSDELIETIRGVGYRLKKP